MRHPKPDFVIEWQKHKPAPKCCHTCEFYHQDGTCSIHQERPPAEFAAAQNQCELWELEIPF